MGGRCAGSERGQEARASIFSVTLQRLGSGPGKAGSNPNPRLKVHGSSGASGGDGEGCGGLGGRKCGCGLPGGNGAFRVARSTGNHCGGHAPGWLASARLLATLGFAMCGRKAVQRAAVAPMRTTARTAARSVHLCLRLRWGDLEGTLQGTCVWSPGASSQARFLLKAWHDAVPQACVPGANCYGSRGSKCGRRTG